MAHARAIFQGDARALDTLMDDDVTVNHPTNRIVKEKQELLNLIKKGVSFRPKVSNIQIVC